MSARPNLARAAWMKWHDLVFLHWRVPIDQIADRLPPGLEVDTFQGQAWLSVVAFRMEMGPAIGPRWLGLDTVEINVRTYVKSREHGPGIFFLSLDVGAWSAVVGARAGLGLPYYHASARHVRTGRRISFESDRSYAAGSFEVSLEPLDFLGRARPGTLDDFLTERYALFCTHAGALVRVRVAHIPYQLQTVRVTWLAHDLFRADGIELGDREPPIEARYVQEVHLDVFRPEVLGWPALHRGEELLRGYRR